MRLCIPLTDLFRSRSESLLPLVGAVSFKELSDEDFTGKANFLESSYKIADPAFANQLEAAGLVEALQSGKYESFACDIGPNCEKVRGYSRDGRPRAVPTSPPVSDQAYLGQVVQNVEWLRTHYAGYFQVENNNYFPTGAYERVCEPEFINKITGVDNVGLLLDIGHAAVSAHYLGYKDVMAYVEALPLHRVREIQLSRAGTLEHGFEDLHDVPGEEEFEIVQEITARGHHVEYLTVEYYGNADVLCDVYDSMSHYFSIAETDVNLN